MKNVWDSIVIPTNGAFALQGMSLLNVTRLRIAGGLKAALIGAAM